jgi:hypothetical protein
MQGFHTAFSELTLECSKGSLPDTGFEFLTEASLPLLQGQNVLKGWSVF